MKSARNWGLPGATSKSGGQPCLACRNPLRLLWEISQYLDYLSGGYSGIGAGFPSAFGYLTPDSNEVYFSPNMFFDFTLISFGVPVGNPPVAVPLTAEEAEALWRDQYAELKAHASQPIIHWPWHDYGTNDRGRPRYG